VFVSVVLGSQCKEPVVESAAGFGPDVAVGVQKTAKKITRHPDE
jgi:hypothetical protein